ncbi:transcriptional regulator [Defluviimonas sp. 20V17]|uniref:Transcriptional regulator n=1 Tax=Allgaiera indica TaxID=765699 RepID=A0AAN4ZY99_9RHOB|nr:YafY family protein [Allgaiera indica]KDB02493.1 transcriptional regulator [Defluviimonas sp. 20V17]GHD98765.1 transcriptional regulator [Allgaiera indica]SDW06653.1 Predicted DNA-binding transcriptional regulator YafY, contains an HTH and WYL domains [Allgaiera indica]
MARADRLFRLLDTLRRLPPPVTAARLAAETGVGPRTLYRDIAALRAGGALIDGAAGYGYALVEDPMLPPQSFSREEIEALVLGLAEVRFAGDRALAAAAETALAKITATLPERQQRQAMHAVVQSYRFERRPEPSVDMGLIRTACWEERALDISYIDAEGHDTTRRIWPLSVVFLDQVQMLLAWCCLRHDFRRFRLDRMRAMAETDESFRPRRVALLREFRDQLHDHVRTD